MLPSVNPYDFTRPVREPSQLAGRREELRRLQGYLDLASGATPRMTNLAILGPRGVGKTSLLGAAHQMASDRGLAVARIALDDELAASDRKFLTEVFAGLGVERPDLESNQAVIRALRTAHDALRAAGRPGAALLIDESDLMEANRTLLQKLRNIFTEVDGYLLVFAGTLDRFPAVVDTFKPFGRFFEAIHLQGFPTFEDTWACLTEPLGAGGAEAVDRDSAADVHLLTGGMPYEVKLAAHYMFDRAAAEGAGVLRLTTAVLDRARPRLEEFRSRPFSLQTPLGDLGPAELSFCRLMLDLPAAYPNLLRLVYTLESLAAGDARAADLRRAAFEQARRAFAQRGLADPHMPDSVFPRDAFARVYLRCAVRERGLPVSSRGDAMENLLSHLAPALLQGEGPARAWLAYRRADGGITHAVEAARGAGGGVETAVADAAAGPPGAAWGLRLPGVPGTVVVASADGGAWLEPLADRLARAGVGLARER
jgi:hypothetical protein